MVNPYYRTCPYCGSNNDPGETCDCIKEREKDTEISTENIHSDDKKSITDISNLEITKK